MRNISLQTSGRNRKQVYAILFFLAIGWEVQQTSAQTNVNTAGGNITGATGSVSYSVGQVVNSTITGTTGSVYTGVQLPYEISIISGIEQTGINLDFKAYPNPTVDNLFLEIDLNAQTPETYYSLIDNSGKVIFYNKVIDNPTTIQLYEMIKGVYYLKISQNDKLVKTFKIIKNK